MSMTVFHGGRPRSHRPAHMTLQTGKGLGSFLKGGLKKVALSAGSAVAQEAKAQALQLTKDVLAGMSLKEAAQGGSLRAVNSLKRQVASEVLARIPARAAARITPHSRGRKTPRTQALAKTSERPLKKARRRAKGGRKRGGKKKRGQRGGKWDGSFVSPMHYRSPRATDLFGEYRT